MRPRSLILLSLLALGGLTTAGLDTAPPLSATPPVLAQIGAPPAPHPSLPILAHPRPLPLSPSPAAESESESESEHDFGPDDVVAAAFDGRYVALTQSLRADPERPVRQLHAELQTADEAHLHTLRSRVLIHALGEVADPKSATLLADLIDRPLPLADPSQHHAEPRAEGTISRALALEALAKVARDSADPAAAQILDETLQRIIDRRDSHHLVVEAITQLRLRSGDTESTRAQLGARLGPELGHLAYLQLRNTLPPTPEGN